MSTQVVIFLVALMICLTIIIRWVLDYVIDAQRLKSDKEAEYWRGRYSAIVRVFDKASKFEFSEEILEKIEKLSQS